MSSWAEEAAIECAHCGHRRGRHAGYGGCWNITAAKYCRCMRFVVREEDWPIVEWAGAQPRQGMDLPAIQS